MMSIRKQHGFTLVELLIVIVIIAILATITIVTYTGIQNRARASAASSALSQAVKKLELYKVDNSAYPTSTNLASAGITNANDTTYQYTSDGTTYCLTATNVTISYYLNSTTTPSPTAGGCPGHGVGGNSAITNLASDPIATINWGRGAGTGGVTTATVVDDNRFPGGKAYKITWTTAPTSTSALYVRTSQNYTVAAGDQYYISIYYSLSWSGATPYFYLGGTPSMANATVTSLGNNVYRASASVTFTAGGSVTLGLLSLVGGSALPQVGDTLLAGGAMVVKGGGQYTYADGNSPNWVWNGTANASTSTGPAL